MTRIKWFQFGYGQISLRSLVALQLCGILWAMLPCTALASPLGDIDQQNVGGDVYTNGAIAPFSFGQSFTPTFSAVDAFEFLLNGFETTAIVRIRDEVAGPDGLGGNIIAESLPTTFSVEVADAEWIHFDFPNQVPLTPGHVYVAELRGTDGGLNTRSSFGNQYSGGQFFNEGLTPNLFTGADLFFREGLHIPEPTSLALAGLALFGFLGRLIRH